MKYLEVQDKKTGLVQVFEWEWDFFEKNPYIHLKRGYKIIGVHDTWGCAVTKGLIHQNLAK